MIARRCLVAGRVQGVFYRGSARERAQSLGVTGHARNLEDGRVEVVACGPPDAVEAFCRWLWQGSPASSVRAVDVETLPAGEPDPWPEDFRTG